MLIPSCQLPQDSDVAPMAAVGTNLSLQCVFTPRLNLTFCLAVSPSVALRFKEYRDVVVIPYNNSEDYRQLSVAAWVYCEKDASCSSDPCYLLAKKGSFALGLRSDEIAMAFHNKVPPCSTHLVRFPPHLRHSGPAGNGLAAGGACLPRPGPTSWWSTILPTSKRARTRTEGSSLHSRSKASSRVVRNRCSSASS